VCFETRPGQQLQVDCGQRRVEIEGAARLVWFFVATLGYSRRVHDWAFIGERQAHWFAGMESAFAAFGGVPAEVPLDNARALIMNHDTASREAPRPAPRRGTVQRRINPCRGRVGLPRARCALLARRISCSRNLEAGCPSSSPPLLKNRSAGPFGALESAVPCVET
jgi:transposase